MYDYEELPLALQDGMQRYVEEGRLVGDFLTACLENDLSKAVNRADDKNSKLLPEIVRWMYWNLPQGCWGSQEAVASWHGEGMLATISVNQTKPFVTSEDDDPLCRT